MHVSCASEALWVLQPYQIKRPNNNEIMAIKVLRVLQVLYAPAIYGNCAYSTVSLVCIHTYIQRWSSNKNVCKLSAYISSVFHIKYLQYVRNREILLENSIICQTEFAQRLLCIRLIRARPVTACLSEETSGVKLSHKFPSDE